MPDAKPSLFMPGLPAGAVRACLICLALGACAVPVGTAPTVQLPPGAVDVSGEGFVYSSGAAPASQDNGRFAVLLNDERGNVSVQPVTFNQTLANVAQAHASDMAQNDYLSHTGLDGSSFEERLDASGYQYDWAAENILQGTTDEASAVQGWMNSPAHRDAMLDPRAQEFGLGLDDDIYVLIVADPSGL